MSFYKVDETLLLVLLLDQDQVSIIINESVF